MPADLDIDWTLAKLLRAQRFTFTQIGQKLGCNPGTIKSRACRENWSESVAQAEHIAVQSATVVSLKHRAEAFVREMADDVDETLAVVRKGRKPKSLPKILERESALEKLNKRARLTYGLDTGDAGGSRGLVTNVHVNVVGAPSGASSAEKPAIDVSNSSTKVIDVSSEPEA